MTLLATTLSLGSLSGLLTIALGLVAFIALVYGVVKREDLKRADATADRWQTERDAAVIAAARLEKELADEKHRCARQFADLVEEQRNVRHDLKTELAARDLEIGALRKTRDLTAVLQGVQDILAELASAKDATAATLAELLERSDERASARDAAIIETQRSIAAQLERHNAALERLADRIVGQVADVVQATVDQLQQDPPTS